MSSKAENPPAPVWRITSYVPSHKQFSLSDDLTPEQISAAVGCKAENPNHDKTTHQWTFYAERYVERESGDWVPVCLPCSIWDYYDKRWSAYGPADAFRQIGLLPPLEEDEQP